MRIAFVLPIPPLYPIGGVRVVYEYANHLSARGHDVVVTYPRSFPPSTLRGFGRRSYWRSLRGARQFKDHPAWMAVAMGVETRGIPTLSGRFLPQADVLFATGWQTAQVVFEAPARSGRKFQLVQHYETWSGSRRAVDRSLRLPIDKIVISRWLMDVAAGLGQRARTTYIPNGMDLEAFFVESDPAQREPARVAMLLHKSKWKGVRDGLEALTVAHERRPQIRADLFSTAYKPSGLRDWMSYHERPFGERLRRIYNNASIFLHPSISEGWPLPPAEAMACGCAVVATDNPGVLDYADPERTALVAPRGDSVALADAIVRLVDDPDLRLRISRAGRDAISLYTWDRAVDSLEAVIAS